MQVDNLSVAFSMYNKGLSKRDLEVIHELSIDVKKGEIVAVNGCGVLLITHDVDLALNVADRIAVSILGTIVEIAKVEDFIKGKDALRHPYSKAFIDALPQNKFKELPGYQPYAGNLPRDVCLEIDVH